VRKKMGTWRQPHNNTKKKHRKSTFLTNQKQNRKENREGEEDEDVDVPLEVFFHKRKERKKIHTHKM
jgi:hypothetical protein